MRYGLGYMGSKNQIAEKLIAQLPKAEYFVDLFAGGCAMTHCAMLSGKYKKFIANDLGSAPQLFKDAIDGKFANEKRWISREDFFALKDSEPYVKYCWSFGNDGRTYMYGRHIEQFKKALHYKKVFGDDSLYEKCKGENAEILESLQRLQSLQSLQRLQRLQRLQSLQDLQVFQKDYREVELPDDCVIYCDIPYRNTEQRGYAGGKFDYDAFYEWAGKQKNIYISEYSMPDDLFDCVYSVEKRSLLNSAKEYMKKLECLYVPKGAKQDRYIDALFVYDEESKEYKYA